MVPANSVLDSDSIQKIVRGRHHDPFHVLGIHPLPEGGMRVNTFLPDARRVKVVPTGDGPSGQWMKKIHPDGLFEVIYPDQSSRFRYRIREEYGDGHTRDFYHAYQYEPTISPDDLEPLDQGKGWDMYRVMGCHPHRMDDVEGYRFGVWAPNARRVSVVGDFNEWDGRRHMMRVFGDFGVWEIFIPRVEHGDFYKYEILTRDGEITLNSDPYAFCSEHRPGTASVAYGIPDYDWYDRDWMDRRDAGEPLDQPLSIYEVHLPTWRRTEDGDMLSYRELAHRMVDYLEDMNFTHVELMPVMEHPLDESWGYQITGYFAPTRRLGNPEDFMYFVDYLHQHGFGVILDWVPGHFPRDEHALTRFDGTYLYEHADPRRGYHPDWHTSIFNFERDEVRSFLLSNALYWMDCFHVDGLRVDAVASMLYRDYSREEGQWVPNEYGGREDIAAITLLREANEDVHARFPGALTLAEESTTWGGITRPTYEQGLGFDLKWNMGWMHDTLDYLSKDPIYRKHHHQTLSFMLFYAFEEQFVLVLSHDEVVHGKRSLLEKMPGDDWQKFANLRLLFGFQMAHPGKSLLFMGGEFAQRDEWQVGKSLDWHLLQYEPHHRLQDFVRRLNGYYQDHPCIWRHDLDPEGFQWIDDQDWERSVITFLRRDPDSGEHRLFVFNFTPVPRGSYRIGVPRETSYREVINSDRTQWGGSGVVNESTLSPESRPHHGRDQSLSLSLPPLGMVVLEPE